MGLWKSFKKTDAFWKLRETTFYKAVRVVYRAVKKLKNKIKKRLAKIAKFYKFKIYYPGIYKKYAKDKVDPKKVIFIEGRMDYITNSSEYIYNELRKNYKFDIHTHFLQMGFVKKKTYNRLCVNLIKDLATAKYAFMNDSSNVIACLPVRNETVITQLWHGCGAFKKFGMSTADLIFGDDRKTQMKYPYHKNYTHVTVSAPEVEWAYEEAMCLKKGIVKGVGVSRTDFFFKPESIANAKENLLKVFPAAKDKKVILYAPTFRGRVAKAKRPARLDITQFGDAFRDEYVLIFKHHPFIKSRTPIPEGYEDFAIDCTDSMSIDDLICVADICISDYSSLVFEYSLFEKPMLFFAYDLDNYYDWRGFYYDYKDFVPGPIMEDNESMIDYIKNLDTSFDKQKVIDFRDKFMCACDGNSTKKIMELTFGKALEQYKD